MAGNPADVRRTPEHIRRLGIERPLHRQHRLQQVAGARVLNTLGFAGRSRRVENEQWMFGIYPDRFANIGLVLHQVVPPDVTRRFDPGLTAGALVDDDIPDTFASSHRQGLVYRGF